jgi:hypothetical protein
MSARYYEVAMLAVGRSAAFGAMELSVDLDATTADDMICNDGDLLTRKTKEGLLYVSGGGSVLVSDRYLLVVERETRARVHPGKFSLFTGRADNLAERENPSLLVREFFEELLLYRNGKLVWPQNTEYQDIIDRAYAEMELDPSGAVAVAFNRLPLPTRQLAVTSSGKTRRFDLTWHISSKGEINVLQLFSADIPLEELSARDGERLGRNIWAYDVKSCEAFPVSGTSGHVSRRKLTPADMTEHLSLVINSLAETGMDAVRAS